MYCYFKKILIGLDFKSFWGKQIFVRLKMNEKQYCCSYKNYFISQNILLTYDPIYIYLNQQYRFMSVFEICFKKYFIHAC